MKKMAVVSMKRMMMKKKSKPMAVRLRLMILITSNRCKQKIVNQTKSKISQLRSPSMTKKTKMIQVLLICLALGNTTSSNSNLMNQTTAGKIKPIRI